MGPRLRVVSYNVHSLRDDAAALDATVRAIAPDVLVVQEALRWVNPLTWFADLPRRFAMVRRFGGLRSFGNVVLVGARITVQRRRFVMYPLAFGHYPRGAVLLWYSVEGVPFLVAVRTCRPTRRPACGRPASARPPAPPRRPTAMPRRSWAPTSTRRRPDRHGDVSRPACSTRRWKPVRATG
jgi:hypothetical protein